jgi:hypothetical protein
MMTRALSCAPVTPLTTANVVTMPSFAPKTRSPMWWGQEGQKPRNPEAVGDFCIDALPF